MSLRLEWLVDHPQHSDTYAEWIHRQFAYEYAEQPLAEWQREFAAGQNNGDWSCLIALDGERLLGVRRWPGRIWPCVRISALGWRACLSARKLVARGWQSG